MICDMGLAFNIRRFLAVLLLICGLPALSPAQQAKPAPPTTQEEITTSPQTITSVVNLVNVPLTVTDKKNRLVIMMTKDDFNLFEDGKPQSIQYFSRETDLALRIGLLDRYQRKYSGTAPFRTTSRHGFSLGYDSPGKGPGLCCGV